MEVSEVCSKQLQVIKMKHIEKSVLLKDIENQLKEKKVGVVSFQEESESSAQKLIELEEYAE